jgi:hypothetical protein
VRTTRLGWNSLIMSGTPLPTSCFVKLALTKMNWNSANIAGLVPVTLHFSKYVGEILREVPETLEREPKYKYHIQNNHAAANTSGTILDVDLYAAPSVNSEQRPLWGRFPFELSGLMRPGRLKRGGPCRLGPRYRDSRVGNPRALLWLGP